ncbi:hypothetical protein ACH473_10710 [Cellulosimicrobium funkei]|uniref:hypothetical protein n=1 Tax=Cellulosimicrobium funkei TaxID=264251 RepID=UPI00375664C3
MAIDKGLGYEGTVVNGLELHEWSRLTGRTMLAPSVSGGQVTVVPSATRTVRVSAGPIFGHAIRDELVQEEIGPLPEVQSGSQYFMLVRAAEWGTTNKSSIKVVAGTSSRAIPPFQQEPGTRADTPLALVRITKDQPLPTEVVDLRLIAEEPGIYTIFDDLALQLADRPGVQCYNANTRTLWSRVYNAQQQRVWIPTYPDRPAIGPAYASYSVGTANITDRGTWLTLDIPSPGYPYYIEATAQGEWVQTSGRHDFGIVHGSATGGTLAFLVNLPTGTGFKVVRTRVPQGPSLNTPFTGAVRLFAIAYRVGSTGSGRFSANNASMLARVIPA